MLKHLPNRVRVHGDVALGVHQLGAVSAEQRAREIDAVGGLAHADRERHPGLGAGLGGLEMRVVGPAVGRRRVLLARGYIATTSSPAFSFSTLIRPHGPLFCVPTLVGTATQCPFTLARYSQI